MNIFRLVLCCFCIVSYTSISIGQISITDSLERLLLQTKTTKSERVTIGYQLAKLYVYTNPSQTIKYAYQVLQELEEKDYDKKGMTYNLLATANAEKSNLDQALKLLDTAIFYYDKIHAKAEIADIYNNIGGVHIYKYQYKEAVSYFYKSLKLYDELAIPLEKAAVLNNLIGLNIYLKEYEEGLKNALEAIELYKTQQDSIGMTRSKFNQGVIYLYLNQLNEAFVIFDEIIPFFVQEKLYDMAVLAYLKKGFVYKEQGKTIDALACFDEALKLKAYISSQNTLIELFIGQAGLLFNLKNYTKSLESYQLALDSAKVINNYYFQQEALTGLIKNFEKLGKYEEAYKGMLALVVVQDTIDHENNQQKIKELEIKYETEKTSHDNILLTKELDYQSLEATRNKQLFYVTLGALLLLSLLSILLINQYKTNAKHITNQLKSQLLRNQMNPHFLFNALVAIQSFVYENKPLEAGDYLSSFATLMRAILDNSMEEYISAKKELEWLENYLSLQLLRFDNKFEYNIKIDENVSLTDTYIPPMLIQPFVENALEHGLKNLNHKGKIDIHLHLVNGQLQIDVQDNGLGFDTTEKASKKNHLSHALNITQERLAYLNKKLKDKIFFAIQSELEKGTLVSFSIPFKSLHN